MTKTPNEKEKIVKEAQQRMANVALKELPIIYDFTLNVIKKFGTFIKSVVVFGSFAKGDLTQESDVDLFIIIDDASVGLTPEIISFYNKELNRLLKQGGSDLKFHLTTAPLSEFWDSVRRGDPLIISIIREGTAIADSGFFAPVKRLLEQGKIRPTDEAIELAINRAIYHLDDYAMVTLNGINALYWSAIEAAHAALMTEGCTPASPNNIVTELEKLTIGSKEDRETFEGIYSLMKQIVHRQKFEVAPEELRYWKDKITTFVLNMKAVVDKKKEKK